MTESQTTAVAGEGLTREFVRRGPRATITEDLIITIVNYIRLGSYVETAVAAAGVPKPTFYDWMKRAAEDRGIADEDLAPDRKLYRQLSDSVEKGMADAEIRDLNVIGLAATTQWQAAAWRLERRNRERWGRPVQVKVSGDEDHPIHVETKVLQEHVDFTKLSDDELADYIGLSEKLRGGADERSGPADSGEEGSVSEALP